MFKSSRWRSEKNKIKIVFKLQFHATQVTQLKADGLTISLVPGDVTKSTAKPEKATLLDGHCRWESPVYETVKFLQDAKTGKLNQRIYHLIVSTTGSTKSGFVGETSIDFADYVDAIKTCNVSLPLQNSNSKAMLHVSIQRQLENVDLKRVVKESDSLVKRSQSQDFKSHLSIEVEESHKSDSPEEGPFVKASRVAELRRRASIESDSTLSSFDSVSELDTLGEFGSRGDLIHQNHSTMHHHSESEWSGSSDQGISTDDSMNTSNDTVPKNTSRTSSDEEVEKLKTELLALARRADLSELELQSLRKQIVKETKRSQDLLREVTSLKQEKDSVKADCESIKASDKRKEDAKIRNKLHFEGKDPQALLEETREELDYEKHLNSDLRLQLQKTEDSNNELILAVQGLEAMLGQRRKSEPRPRIFENKTEESRRRSCTSDTDEDEDQKALDELVKGHMDAKEAHVLERRITDLYNEIEIYKRDKDDLEIQVEQLALDYEILKSENHNISYKLEQSQVQEQLKMQYECSSSLVNVNELQNQVESLEAKLKKQSEEFSESLFHIKELETQLEGMEEERESREAKLKKQSEEFSESLCRVKELEMQVEGMEDKLESLEAKLKKQSEEFSESLCHVKELETQVKGMEEELESQEAKLKNQTEDFSCRVKELETQLEGREEELESLEAKLKNQSMDFSESLCRVKELETQIEDMEEELERQAQIFEADLEAVTLAKVEQEQRAIEAEEALRKTRSKNASVAGKIQEEFKRISEQMASTLAANEKMTMKAVTETHELQMQKRQLEELLMNANDEIVANKVEYEAKLNNLLAKFKNLENQKRQEEEVITLLKSELETARARYDDLALSSKNESEIEKHRSEVKKKEEEVANLENREVEANNETKTDSRSDMEKTKQLEEQINVLEASSNIFIEKERDLKNQIKDLQNKLNEQSQNSKEKSESLHGPEAIPLQNKSEDIEDLVKEMVLLREENGNMETELKELQERYSEISLRFAEVEGERQQLVMTVRYLKNVKKS